MTRDEHYRAAEKYAQFAGELFEAMEQPDYGDAVARRDGIAEMQALGTLAQVHALLAARDLAEPAASSGWPERDRVAIAEMDKRALPGDMLRSEPVAEYLADPRRQAGFVPTHEVVDFPGDDDHRQT